MGRERADEGRLKDKARETQSPGEMLSFKSANTKSRSGPWANLSVTDCELLSKQLS